ncbi:hypothetical protein ACJX0J_039509, partial [Zea mays]
MQAETSTFDDVEGGSVEVEEDEEEEELPKIEVIDNPNGFLSELLGTCLWNSHYLWDLLFLQKKTHEVAYSIGLCASKNRLLVKKPGVVVPEDIIVDFEYEFL